MYTKNDIIKKMIIGKNFFITEMPKTGTSFLRNYFKYYSNIKITTHHDTIEHYKEKKLLHKKYRIGTIRSPYTWYLSLWKWSCLKKKYSPLYSDLTSRRIKIRRLKFNYRLFNYLFIQITKNTDEIENLFKNVNSKKNFNKFLQILLNHKYKNYLSSDFSFTQNQKLGFMTYSFFYQNAPRKYHKKNFLPNQNFSKLIKEIDSKIFTNYYFKTESLEKDLQLFLKKNKIKLKQFKHLDKNSTNISPKIDYKKFFSKKNLKLIEKNENYLFKKFKYKKISSKIIK
tara:strand:- start:102 stop:953 length:852 start_codon:yes stop_codon:yes gene_type:complete